MLKFKRNERHTLTQNTRRKDIHTNEQIYTPNILFGLLRKREAQRDSYHS